MERTARNRLLAIGIVFVAAVALFFTTCSPGETGRDADASNLGGGDGGAPVPSPSVISDQGEAIPVQPMLMAADPVVIPAPEPIADTGTLLSDAAEAQLLGSASAVQCWNWEDSAFVKNSITGAYAYRFGIELTWCNNAAHTVVTSRNFSNLCKHLGGYFTFVKCTRSRGSFNLSKLSVYDRWTYTLGACPACVTRNPSYDVNLGPHGGVNGTVYYDD
jgi:hypothetical protein